MLMRLLDMLCVHACCRVSLPLALLAIQFCFVLPPWVILILNLILNNTRLRVYKTVFLIHLLTYLRKNLPPLTMLRQALMTLMVVMVLKYLMLMVCRRLTTMVRRTTEARAKNEKGQGLPIWRFACVSVDIFMSVKTKRKLPASSHFSQNRCVPIWHRRKPEGTGAGKQEEGSAVGWWWRENKAPTVGKEVTGLGTSDAGEKTKGDPTTTCITCDASVQGTDQQR